MFRNILLIGLGGAVGSIFRFLIGWWIGNKNFPNSEKIKNQFAKLLYSKDTEGRNLYKKNNICEIIPSLKNMLYLINIIFDFSKFI